MALLNPRAGERILEVGVGTGYGINEYPIGCRVVAIDYSLPMLRRAVDRAQASRRDTLSFCQMDAANLAFPGGSVDAVYVPYMINCVADPPAVGRELRRVCVPGGRLVFLNHFAGVKETSNAMNTFAGHFARAAGVDWELRLDTFLEQSNLRACAIESVNIPRLSSVVLCSVEQ